MVVLTYDDGYHVAKMIAKGVDVTKLRRIHDVLKKALDSFAEESDEKDFMLGLVEGLGEIARLREELTRLISLAKSLGITIEVNMRYDEE